MNVQEIQLAPPVQLPIVSLPQDTPVDYQYYSASLDKRFGSIYLDNNAKQATIDNYCLYVEKYNDHVKEYNKMVHSYNNNVEKTLKNGLSNAQKRALNEFCSVNWNKPIKTAAADWLLGAYDPVKAFKASPKDNIYHYNALVRQFNEKHGDCLPLLTVVGLRDTYRDTFENLLYWYSGLLAQYSLSRNSAGVYGLPLPKMNFNYYNLANSKRKNGAKANTKKARTFQNHRKRLEEAGIIIQGQFHGTNQARTFYFNPEILVVWDPNSSKNATTENQAVSALSKKSLPNKFESTLSVNKNRDKQNEDSLPLEPLNTSYIQTNLQEKKSFARPPANIVKNQPKIEKETPAQRASKKRASKIVHINQLANELKDKMHLEHKPFDKNDLHDEAVNGSLSRLQLQTLLIQDLIKAFSVLWASDNVFFGSWKNAIQLMLADFFQHNGNLVDKQTMIKHYYYHLEVLEHVKRYMTRFPDYKLRYPSIYFDKNRVHKSEGGYITAMRLKKAADKERKKTDKLKEENEENARRRAYRRSRNTKMRTITRKYCRGKISRNELVIHVITNLAEYKNDIDKWINDEQQAINC